MGKGALFWSGQRVMERWGIYTTELAAHIYRGLRALRMEGGQFHEVPPDEVNHFDADHMTDFIFDPEEITRFEKENGLTPIHGSESEGSRLSAKDAQELGRLREEKLKWDSSIVAAAHVGIFCATIGRPVVRREVDDEIYKVDPQIPKTTMDKLWKALPNKYKKGAGRPKKE